MDTIGDTAASAASSCLICVLAGAEYAIPSESVNAVLDAVAVAPLPRVPDRVEGLMNLRGEILPILSLRRLFKLPEPERSDGPVIVLRSGVATGLSGVGVRVDEVLTVTALDATRIAPVPKLGGTIPNRFALGIVERDGRPIVVLDVERLVSADEIFDEPEEELTVQRDMRDARDARDARERT